jgi:hypothetical protein
MTMQPEPLNFKLARVTPKWALKQAARRWMVVLFFAVPFLAGTAAGYINSLWSLLFAPFAIVPIVLFVWLVGATNAKADSPEQYLDEREIALRNQVYLESFRLVGALVALGFILTTLLPNLQLEAKTVFGMLFPLVIVLPTCVLAWIAPDPLEEA